MSHRSILFPVVAVLLLVAFPVLAASPDPEIFSSPAPVVAPASSAQLAGSVPLMQIAKNATFHTAGTVVLADQNDQSSGGGGSWVSRHKVLTVILIIAVSGGIYAASRGGYHKKPPGGGGNPGGGY